MQFNHSNSQAVFLIVLNIVFVPFETQAKFIGHEVSEYRLKFQHQVEIPHPTLAKTSLQYEEVQRQIKYLFGSLAFGNLKTQPAAAPKNDHSLAILGATHDFKKNITTVSYSYEGTVIVQDRKSASSNRDNNPLLPTILFPINPYRAHQKGFVGETNLCTDPHYQTFSDFWYFWRPTTSKCPLKEGIDYQKVQATWEPLPKIDTPMHPRYQDLVQNKEIVIHAFFGKYDDDGSNRPGYSDDYAADEFLALRDELKSKGFTEDRWSRKRVKKFLGGTFDGETLAPFVSESTLQTGRATIRVRLFFGVTSASGENRAFHRFIQDAYETASVVIYNGHSGLGGNLNRSVIESNTTGRIRFPQDQYQIYYFNGCSTYAYFNDYYARLKPKNLDILTNGVESLFSMGKDSTQVLINAVTQWARTGSGPSYQTIAKQMEYGNLFGVNLSDFEAPRP